MPVRSLEEAHLVLDVLAAYDDFQFKNRIKPDYANAGGLVKWDDDEKKWIDYYDEATGEDFDEFRTDAFGDRFAEIQKATKKSDGG